MKAEVVFCDDIRTEANGKLILIGVYPNDLVPGVMPQTLSLAMMVKIYDFGEVLPKYAHLTITPPGGGQPFNMNLPNPATGGYIPGDPFLLILGGLPIEIRSYGDITVDLSLEGGTHQRIARLPVRARGKPS